MNLSAFNMTGHRLDIALASIRSALVSAGIPDAAYEARTLVMAALGISRETLLTSPETHLTDQERTILENMVNRRMQREPLQYVTGSVEFYGRVFNVDSRVLIPRPETELLVEQALAFADERGFVDPRILDIGVGSGALAVTLAAELPTANVVATDISVDAIAVAQKNAQSLSVQNRIEFIECSLTASVHDRFDIIVCNPPYVLSGFLLSATVQPELSYEPAGALDGGTDGMTVYRPLLASLKDLLTLSGAAFIEIDPPVAEECVALAKSHLPRAIISVLTDLAGLERCLVIELPHY